MPASPAYFVGVGLRSTGRFRFDAWQGVGVPSDRRIAGGVPRGSGDRIAFRYTGTLPEGQGMASFRSSDRGRLSGRFTGAGPVAGSPFLPRGGMGRSLQSGSNANA